MRVAIVGQGYVGVSIGVAAHEAGHEVSGVEINIERISDLKNLGYLVTSDHSVVKTAEIVLIAVPTPLDSNHEPDLTFLKSACLAIRPHLKVGTLIINESTSYPGTLREVIATSLGNDFEYAVAPERVDPGNLVWNAKNTPRIVGALSETALDRALTFYKTITSNVIEVSSPEIAEAAKLFENTFRQVNIALVNEFAQIAHTLGFSAYETLNAANSKPFGFMRFLPSIGVGGHCIPIDPTYLSYVAERSGIKANFIDLANKLNREMPIVIANRIDREYSLKGKKVQIVGLTYKPNVPDLRESPSIPLIAALRNLGAHVTWHDPLIEKYNEETSAPLSSVDIGIICVAHDGIDYSPWIKSNVRILDLSISEKLNFPKYF